MKSSQIFACCGAVGTMLLLPSAISAQEQGFYVKGDLGAAMTEDVKIKNFLGIQNPGKIELDTGIRFDFGGGYNFNRWLAAEFETGIIYNSIANQGDSSLSSIPLMVNAVVNIPISKQFVPFIGVGGGGVVSVFSGDDFSVEPGTYVHGSDSDLVAAWQGFAGFRYNINEKLSVNLSYKYLATADPSWDAQDDYYYYHGPSLPIEFEGSKTHAVVLGVDFKF
jgi:opacity protein-like surface antigen